MLPKFQKVGVRNLVVLILVLGSCYLAVIDKEFRNSSFGNIVNFGLGGYTGQLVPRL